MDLTLAQLRSKLGKGLRGGVFFLHGSEAFLKAEAVGWVVDAHLGGAERAFNLDIFRGDAATGEMLASALATPPALAFHRVVVAHDAQELSPSARGVLESAVERLPPDVALVVTAEIPKGSKAKFYDALKAAGVAARAEPPPESALPGWLMERARAVHGLELEPAAAALLASFLGRSLGPLAEELRKLADYVAPRTRIEPEDVRAVAGVLPQVTIWDWVDLVMGRHFDRALALLRHLFDGGESGVGVVRALGEAFIRTGLAGAGGDALERALKRENAWKYLAWKAKAYRAHAAAWLPALAERALEECLRTDRLLKSGGLDETARVEELLLRLAALEPAAGAAS